MNEDIKVGDIVYWYVENEGTREIMYREYPSLRDGYGVVQRAGTVVLGVSFPSIGETIGLYRDSCHKVVME